MKKISKVIPLYLRIIIRPDKADDKYGNIILPPQAQKPPLTGTVVGVGHGILQKDGTLSKMMTKAGDRVLYHEYSGLKFFLDNEEFLQCDENNLVALIEEVEYEEGNEEVPELRFENVTGAVLGTDADGRLGR